MAMRQSELFTKARREAPKDEVSKNARLLIQAGYIDKVMAGVYSYLPLGLMVLEKINNVIREEMNSLGAQEIMLTALQNPEIWEKTGRWNEEVWFKTSLKAGGEIGLGWTQEEEVTEMAKRHIQSYKDLPFSVYQIQTKFRNEERAKSGIMRSREFLMKDLYSFHANSDNLDLFYEKCKEAYLRVFKRCGLGRITYVTFASGGVFSRFSHEFQTVSDSGEDTIYLSEAKGIAVNKEVNSDEVINELGLDKKTMTEKKAIEVGNIFKLGIRFSEPLGLLFADENGEKRPAIMGSYGIGPGRVLGAIVETLSDEKGIIWPEEVSPFRYHLLALEGDEAEKKSDELYEKMKKRSIEVLYDDRDNLSAGEKFAEADLLGISERIVISQKTLLAGKLELKNRQSGEIKGVSEKEALGV